MPYHFESDPLKVNRACECIIRLTVIYRFIDIIKSIEELICSSEIQLEVNWGMLVAQEVDSSYHIQTNVSVRRGIISSVRVQNI
jgi:hypothetical protein